MFNRPITAAMALVAMAASLAAQSRDGSIEPGCWTLDKASSTLTVHVYPGGLFSPALHAHHFVPTDWRGEVCFTEPSVRRLSVDLTVAADSLQDRQPELSEEDRRTVQRQVREDVLMTDRHPEIRFAAGRFEIEHAGEDRARGRLHGQLSLRGTTRDIQVPVQATWSAERLRVTGDVRVKQSDFGIEPYSRFLGTVRVEDEVRIEFAVEARPSQRSGRADAAPLDVGLGLSVRPLYERDQPQPRRPNAEDGTLLIGGRSPGPMVARSTS